MEGSVLITDGDTTDEDIMRAASGNGSIAREAGGVALDIDSGVQRLGRRSRRRSTR
jgi:hypothetical protein